MVNLEPIMVLLTDTSNPEELYECLDKVEAGYTQYLIDSNAGNEEEANMLSLLRELRKAIQSAGKHPRIASRDN